MQIIKLVLLLVVFFVSAVELFVYIKNNNIPIGIEFTNQEPNQDNTVREVFYVAGAVKNPGTYSLKTGMRVGDAIALAGGFTQDLDKSYVNDTLNLAAVVKDEQHLYIPFNSVSELVKDSGGMSQKININNASKEELIKLPGVGGATADKIIANRPYKSADDLLKVQGIGEAKLANFLGSISF